MSISDYTKEFGTTWCNYPSKDIIWKEIDGQILTLSITNYVQDGVLNCNFTVQHGEKVIRDTKSYAVAMYYYTEFKNVQ